MYNLGFPGKDGTLLLGLVEVVLVPMVGLLFSASFLASPFWLIVLLAAGTIGFISMAPAMLWPPARNSVYGGWPSPIGLVLDCQPNTSA